MFVITLDRLFGRRPKLPRLQRMGAVIVIRVGFVGRREFFVPLLGPALLRRFDVLHVHATDQMLDAAALLQPFHGRSIVATTHGLFFHTRRLYRTKKLYFSLITRRSLRRCRAVFAVSESDAAAVRRIGISPILLRNPILPLGDFISEGRDLVYVGRIAENKQIPKLLQFAQALSRRDPFSRVHIVGSDPDKLWPAMSRALIPPDRVTYHGFLDAGALQSLLISCGFVVSASRYEGFGLSVVEGMSVGLLPILNDNAAFREIVQRAGVGMLTDFDKPDQAAAEFLAFRDRATQGDRELAASFAHAQSWDSVARAVGEEYAPARG